METSRLILASLILILFFTSNIDGIGFSPPQARVVGVVPVSDNIKVADIMLTNTGNEPAGLMLQVTCLEKSRPHKLRVICTSCSREIGIQRGDLISPAKLINLDGVNGTIECKDGEKYDITIPIINITDADVTYMVGDYVLVDKKHTHIIKKIDEKELLLGKKYCPFCGTSEEYLIFYDFTPSDILDRITLVCDKNPLRKTGRTYAATNIVGVNDAVAVDVYLNFSSEEIDNRLLNIISGGTGSLTVEDVDRLIGEEANASMYVDYINRYYGKHWEARITVTFISDQPQEGTAIQGGGEIKFLIDTVPFEFKEKEEMKIDDQAPMGLWTFMVMVAGAAGAAVIVIVAVVKTRKRTVNIPFPSSKASKEKSLDRIIKGRKLL